MGDSAVRQAPANFNMVQFYPAFTPAGGDITPEF